MNIDEKIMEWSKNIGLMGKDTTQEKRFTKLVEEVGELGRCILHDDIKSAMMEIGDIYVVLVQIAYKHGYAVQGCAHIANDKNSQRDGHLHNGTFVKD